MYLKSIELSGFKSFAKKSLLEFGKPVTAVVGPNGSGKSNIAESFRFVLGEQSIKSLRGQKGEDLIWNGSSETPRSSRASVKIVFDNRKKFLNLDYDEVIIERSVFRDGVNEYMLNGSKVRLKDIMEVLSPANIGPSGHHIISQGEADKILNANPKERRNMIEDALGLRIYQYKKRESEKKLLKTEENIERVESLQKELSPHIRFLRKQYEKLQKTKDLRSELLQLSTRYFTSERYYLDEEIKRIEREKIAPAQRLDELQDNLSKATSVLKEGVSDEKKSKLLEIESGLSQLRVEKGNLERNLGRVEGRLSASQSIIKDKILSSQEELFIERASVEKLKDEALGLKDEIERSQDIDFIRNVLKRIVQGLFELLQKNTEIVKEEEKSNSELEGLEEEKRLLELKIRNIEEKEIEIAKSFKNLQVEIEREKDVDRDLEKSVFKIKAEESELRAVIFGLKEVFQRLTIESQTLEGDVREVKALVGGEVLDSLMRNSSHGMLPRPEALSLRKEIEKLKIRLEESGSIGEDVEKEYKEISERSAFLLKELEDLKQSAISLKQLIKDLESDLDQSFKSGIVKINQKFSALFSLMFDGGSANLFLVKEKKRMVRGVGDEEDMEIRDEVVIPENYGEPEEETDEGLDIKIALPRKKVKSLEMLSGGERALVSIALIFSVSQVNPPPFLILDETDAALDEANSRRYGDMLEALAGNSQLILITHNRETMSRAGILYGITMGQEGFSRILSVAFEEAVTVAKS